MSQINVSTPEPREVVDSSGDRSAAAGINPITVLIVLAVLVPVALLAALLWWAGAIARRRRREHALDTA